MKNIGSSAVIFDSHILAKFTHFFTAKSSTKGRRATPPPINYIMSESRPITFDRVMRTLATLAILGIIVWLIGRLQNVLLPFCVAALIAYMLEPIVEYQQEKLGLKSRIIPVFLTLFELCMVIGTAAYFIVPNLIDELCELEKMIKTTSIRDLTPNFLPAEIQHYIYRNFNLAALATYLEGTRMEAVINKGTSVLASTIGLLMHTIEWLLTFVYVIFIMIDYKPLMRGFKLIVPPKYRSLANHLGRDIKVNMDRYFRSQALIAMFATVFYCIGFALVGLPMSLIMGLMVGILFLIPYFQYITLIPVAILCFITSMGGEVSFWSMFGQCILVYIVSQSVCDYILTPKIMKNALGLNPAIILLSLSIWGTLLGIIGMIIALPATALLIGYYDRYVVHPRKIRR